MHNTVMHGSMDSLTCMPVEPHWHSPMECIKILSPWYLRTVYTLAVSSLSYNHQPLRLSVTNLSLEITCQCFNWMLQLSSGWKWRSVNKHCYLYPCTTEDALQHWRSKVSKDRSIPPRLLITVVQLFSPCHLITAVQQPGISSPPSQFKHSSEGIMYLDVQYPQ